MDSDKEKLLARMRAIVEKHLDGVVTFEQGHALIDDLTALFAAPSPAQAADGEYEWPDASLEEVVWLRGCNLYSMKLTDAGVMVRELSGSIWWDKDEVGMNGGWIPCRVARSAPSPAQAVGGEQPDELCVGPYRGHQGIAQYDPEAKHYHGEVSAIRAVVTFVGDTPRTTEAAFMDSVDDYLKMVRSAPEAGEPAATREEQ